MKVVHNRGCINEQRPLGIGLGNFDGLHAGHRVLISTLIAECGLHGLSSMVYTFARHPENIIRKQLSAPLLSTIEKKMELLGDTQLDYLFIDKFDEQFSHIEPEQFMEEVLFRRFGLKLAVAGFDYKFGYKGRGDVDMLAEYGKKLGFEVVIIPPVKIGDDTVSSTLIRDHIKKGETQKVSCMLGRYYSIQGTVVEGLKNGMKLGFPTANIRPESSILIPMEGAYITKTLVEGKLRESVTNIGANPTYNSMTTSIETHILDFSENIYGRQIEVYFVRRLRGDIKFDSAQKLCMQIKKDVEEARSYFSKYD